jgi:hypothetical protein
MKVIHELKLDLLHQGIPQRITAVQCDSCSRVLALQLFADHRPWAVPEDIQVLIRYRKSDRTGGVYDTLPNGDPAWEIRNGVLMVTLAPQALTVPGETPLAITLLQGDQQLTTFPLVMDVQPQPDCNVASENYRYVAAFLPQPSSSAQVGHVLQVAQVDNAGRILDLKATDPGLTAVEQQLLLQLLRNATYDQDVSNLLSALDARWNGGDVAEVPIGLRVLYSGEAQPVGTPLSSLFAHLSVYVHFADGTRRLLGNTEYTLAGHDIAAGNNTVTVCYSNLTATFQVIGASANHFTVTNQMTNALTNNTLNLVKADSYYTACITAAEGYALVYVNVTMGGSDITESAYSDGTITIHAVTGDVVITAVAEDAATAQILLADTDGALLKSFDGYYLAVAEI